MAFRLTQDLYLCTKCCPDKPSCAFAAKRGSDSVIRFLITFKLKNILNELPLALHLILPLFLCVINKFSIITVIFIRIVNSIDCFFNFFSILLLYFDLYFLINKFKKVASLVIVKQLPLYL